MPIQWDPKKKSSGDDGADGAGNSEQSVFSDLSSFRKENVKVSDEDHAKWREEAHRAAMGQPSLPEVKPETPAEKKEETRWERIQRQQRKKNLAYGLFIMGWILVVIQLDVGGKFRAWLVARRGATNPSPAPSVSAAPTIAPSDQTQLAEAFLVCRFEVLHFTKKDTKPLSPEPFNHDWSTQPGPFSIFSPTRQTDALDRYRQLVAPSKPPTRVQLLERLATFARTAEGAAERLAVDAMLGDAPDIRRRSPALLDRDESFAQVAPLRNPVPACLAAGLAELELGGDPARGRAYLERAATEAAPNDPWPARALALCDVWQGQPAEAAKLLESSFTANPKDGLLGCQLAWLYVQAGKPQDADRVLAKLEEIPGGEEARLLRAVAAAGAGDWTRFDPLMQRMEAEESRTSPPFRARYFAIKAQALLARDPNQTQLGRDLYLKTRELDPTCSWADLQLARLLLKQKMLPEAASSYRRFLRRFPASLAARRELAVVLTDGRYLAQALGEYAELVFSDGPREEYLKGVAFAGSSIGRPDLARYVLDRARTLTPR